MLPLLFLSGATNLSANQKIPFVFYRNTDIFLHALVNRNTIQLIRQLFFAVLFYVVKFTSISLCVIYDLKLNRAISKMYELSPSSPPLAAVFNKQIHTRTVDTGYYTWLKNYTGIRIV